jgi:DNA-binding transcriptional MocR family regulator
MTLYRRLADDLSASIRSGVLRPGDRMPSVRGVCRSHHVSPATVLHAYRLLEDRGEIHARSRSGHYVSAHLGNRPMQEPAMSRPSVKATKVDVKDLVFELLESLKRSDIVPLGSAFPAPGCFPLARLARALHAATLKLDPHDVYEQLPPGNSDLRRQIARRYLESGCNVDPEEIVITTGALEGLSLCLQAVTRPGDLVAIESPSFYVALEIIERLGLKAVEIPTHPRDGMNVAALAEALDRHSIKACWVMTNFENPLGSQMPEEQKRELVKLLEKRGVPLIEDDVYGELYFGTGRPKPAKAFDRTGNVMHCSSFSKCLAPGYRVGWATPGRLFNQVKRAKLVTTIATSGPAQVAIAEFLKQGGYNHHLRKLRQTFESQQSRMLQAIGRHFPKDTHVTRPAGGYFLWVELPNAVKALGVFGLANEKNITVAPGPMFSPQRKFENCIRLNYGLHWSPKVEAAIATVGGIVSALA